MAPQVGWNAGVLAGTGPWTSVLRTAVTVTSTATALPSTALANRKGIYVYNFGTVTIFLAFTSDVGTSNEVELFSKMGLFLPLSDAITLYGRVASGTPAVVLWEYVG